MTPVDKEAHLKASVAAFWKRVKRGESMRDASNAVLDWVDEIRSRDERWSTIEEFGRRVGYQPWRRVGNPMKTHSAKFDSCVKSIKTRLKGVRDPYAVCMAALGKKAVRKR